MERPEPGPSGPEQPVAVPTAPSPATPSLPEPPAPEWSLEAPPVPLAADTWTAAGALLFGVAAAVVNALLAVGIRTPAAASAFETIGKWAAALPKPVGGIAVLAVFALLNLLLYGLLLVVPVVHARRRGIPLHRAFGLTRFHPGLAALLVPAAYVVGVSFNGVWSVALQLAGAKAPGGDLGELVKSFSGPVSFVVLFVLVAVVAPVCEELVYRGVVYASLRERWGELPALAVSSLLFGVVHVDYRFAVPAVMLGALLALVFRSTRSLWPAIALHGTYNGVSMLLLLVLTKAGVKLS